MPFQPGQSGNPAGRPRGARNNTTVLIEQLIEGDAEFIMRRLIAQAKAGNPRALSLLMPALLPKRKDRPIELELPTLEEASDAPRAIAAIIAAVCAGEVTPSEGTSLTRMVEAYVGTAQDWPSRAQACTRESGGCGCRENAGTGGEGSIGRTRAGSDASRRVDRFTRAGTTACRVCVTG